MEGVDDWMDGYFYWGWWVDGRANQLAINVEHVGYFAYNCPLCVTFQLCPRRLVFYGHVAVHDASE